MKLDTEEQRTILLLMLEEVQITGTKAARKIVALEDAVLKAEVENA